MGLRGRHSFDCVFDAGYFLIDGQVEFGHLFGFSSVGIELTGPSDCVIIKILSHV